MTLWTFFGGQVLVHTGALSQIGLVLVSGATATLSTLGWHWVRARREPRVVARSGAAGLLLGAVVAGELLLGLRVEGGAYGLTLSTWGLEWLAAAATGLGLCVTARSLGAAVVGLLFPGGAAAATLPVGGSATRDEVATALDAYEGLRAAAERLRQAEDEASTRAKDVSDPVAAAEYSRTALAIAHRRRLADELQATSGQAVVRLACVTPLRRLLEQRPDVVLARLSQTADAALLGPRVQEAQEAVRVFLGRLGEAREAVRRELTQAPGSVAARAGVDAAERARPVEAAVEQVEVTYQRVQHVLEALRLRLAAEADSGRVGGAAKAIVGPAAQEPAQDVVAVALEMTKAEQSAATALSLVGAVPLRIADVVVEASASLARGVGDDDALADVLRTVRRELER